MNKTTVRFLLLVLTVFSAGQWANAQAPSPHHPTRFVVIFEQSANQADINNFVAQYNSHVLWISPGPIGAHLLEVNAFPVVVNLPDGTVEHLVDINEVTTSSSKKSKVKGSGLDYVVYLPWLNTPDNPAVTNPPLPPAYLCPGGSVNTSTQHIGDVSTILMGFLDTGIGMDIAQGTPPTLINPVDNPTLFDPFMDVGSLGKNVVSGGTYPQDDHGHGTHVKSIAASAIDNPNYPIQFKVFKTHDDKGDGFVSDVIYAIDEGIVKGVRVFNASIGYNAPVPDPKHPTPFQVALEYCEANDIIFVAAAGNDGQDNDHTQYPTYPASYDNPNLISVAAMDCDYQLIPASNFGAQAVDIAAPGHMIKGAHIYFNGPNGSNLVVRSGTSMAVPFVAAVAAMGLAHPTQPTAKQVICAILSTATPATGLNGLMTTSGYINGPGVGTRLNNNQNSSCDFFVITSQDQDQDPGFGDEEGNDGIRQWEVFPNPFTDQLVMFTELSAPQEGRFFLMDATGRIVEQMILPEVDAGRQQVEWSLPGTLPQGVYFLQVQIGEEVLTHKVIRQ